METHCRVLDRNSASLFPIIAVMSLALYVSTQFTPEMIIESALATKTTLNAAPWYETTPGVKTVGHTSNSTARDISTPCHDRIAPRKLPQPKMIFFGIFLCVLGMVIFNLGLSYGLSKLGGQSGGLVPAAFTQIENVKDSPLYSVALGLFIALGFAWLLGFGATLAEPALNALGQTVENLTNGSFQKTTLMYAVSLGVAFGIAIGVAKIIFIFRLPICSFQVMCSQFS